VRALARCLSGCEEVLTLTEGKSYKARVRQKVAAFVIGFDLDITVLESQTGRFIRLEISGVDKRLKSDLHQTLSVTLNPVGPKQCRIDVSTTIELSGLLASLGKSLVSMQITQNLEDFVARVRSGIEERASQVVANGSPRPDQDTESARGR